MGSIRHKTRLIGISILLLTSTEISAQQDLLFDDKSVLTIKVDLPISKINASRKQKSPRQSKGLLSWLDEDGTRREVSVKARARGNFRRKNCINPPLRLNFKKNEVQNTLFSGQNKVKLVRPCTNRKRAEQWVVLEYLIYENYQLLTNAGFRVRPVTLQYSGDGNGNTPASQFGFLIEDEDDMATRIGGAVLTAKRVRKQALDPTALARVQLFQFMIGNNDYSLIRADRGLQCCHNTRLVSNDEGLGIRPAPYDFDFAGMVDADYATPPPNINIRSVRTRIYRGFCLPQPEMLRAIALFNEKRALLYQSYQQSEQLGQSFKRNSIAYLDSFFEIINDPQQLNRKIVSRCR